MSSDIFNHFGRLGEIWISSSASSELTSDSDSFQICFEKDDFTIPFLIDLGVLGHIEGDDWAKDNL